MLNNEIQRPPKEVRRLKISGNLKSCGGQVLNCRDSSSHRSPLSPYRIGGKRGKEVVCVATLLTYTHTCALKYITSFCGGSVVCECRNVSICEGHDNDTSWSGMCTLELPLLVSVYFCFSCSGSRSFQSHGNGSSMSWFVLYRASFELRQLQTDSLQSPFCAKSHYQATIILFFFPPFLFLLCASQACEAA